MILHRRNLLTAGAGLMGTALLGGCDRFAGSDAGRQTLQVGEDARPQAQGRKGVVIGEVSKTTYRVILVV